MVRADVALLSSANLLFFESKAIGRSLLKSISSHKVLSLLLSTKRPILEKDELHDFANDFVKSSCPCDLLPAQWIVKPSFVILPSQSKL